MEFRNLFAGVFVAACLSGCAPEPGSMAWCEQMDETPKGEWSMNDASEYAQSCILRQSED